MNCASKKYDTSSHVGDYLRGHPEGTHLMGLIILIGFRDSSLMPAFAEVAKRRQALNDAQNFAIAPD